MKFQLLIALCVSACSAGVSTAASTRFQALVFPAPTQGSTWAVLERDGASREVPAYLSSLGFGETGVGEIQSADITIQADTITFTIRGHDGPQNNSGLNYIALIDAESGAILRQTFAPGSDALQERSWDVAEWKGKAVRILLHDGDRNTAYAWFGVEQILHGNDALADFRQGMPDSWTATTIQVEVKTQRLGGAIPFQRQVSAYSICPEDRAAELPCGFTADRLFFLGCTVAGGRPLDIPGYIEIVYAGDIHDRIPLLVGCTLEAEDKLLSRARPMRLRPSSDPFQHILALTPRPLPIEKIILEKSPRSPYPPRITAVTAMTAEDTDTLTPLRQAQPPARVQQWLRTQAVPSTGIPHMPRIFEAICRRHRLPTPAVHFRKTKISEHTFEAASAFDVDRDGHTDILSGGFWYPGPEFQTEIKVTDVPAAGEYWEDFSDYPMDVNGDGLLDIVTGAFFGLPLRWLENPGGRTPDWQVHTIADVGPIETTRFWDVDGDGHVEIVPNAGDNIVFFRLERDEDGNGTGNFTRHVVRVGGCGHGLGFGDINGDGRGDFVVTTAWIEAPEDPLTGTWTWHDDGFNLGSSSVPILVHDVNEDGTADFIVGQAHAFGLDWWKQVVQQNGARSWTRHPIETASSQYHDLALADLDNDGALELVTGKRYRAHNGNDPGARDPLVIRYFDIDRGAFHPHVIDYGPPETASGLGIYFWIEDIQNDGLLDLIAPGKEGLYLFTNLGT